MSRGNNEKFEEDLAVVEEASPISIRPPAPPPASSSSRWPRQETLALLNIRSQMDSAFRDASILKAPLWEHVSRKLEEMGYKRSAKKCKEKFENVQKYYKRTRERQDQGDGKAYKFFSQLDALQHSTSTLHVATTSANPSTSHDHRFVFNEPRVPSHLAVAATTAAAAAAAAAAAVVSFSTSSSSEGEDDETRHDNPKRKRADDYSLDMSDERMMAFFEGLMNDVMQKQESMQQRFLEAIEKREQDRMSREEAWKRQDMARLLREQQLVSRERATLASRDDAIIAFLQKVTGQTIHLPANVSPIPTTSYQQESPSSQNVRTSLQEQPKIPSLEIVKVVPVQPLVLQGASSRWPKAEVLGLIQLRSGLESRYQEAGPKGLLWEDISLGMQRMGYNRSAKRCKEKWENINKYYKKVKESNKTRPEDSKTCPYFHELDAVYSKKMLGDSSCLEEKEPLEVKELCGKDGGSIEQQSGGLEDFASLFEEPPSQGVLGGEKQQPVDILRKQGQESHEKLDFSFCESSSSDVENTGEDAGENETEGQMKLAYTTQFKNQQNNINFYRTIVQ